MARSASVSKLVAFVAFVAIFGSLGACRLFVDLDGLGDGPGKDGGSSSVDAADEGASDASGTSDGTSPDVVDIPDATPDVNPDVDASAPCPSGKGPTMLRIPTANGSFCIDTTEVTNQQYDAFLMTAPSTANQGPFCSWNTDFTPKGDWPGALNRNAQLPIGYVNWCDATAFCKWAGKRLCGKIGVGAVDGGTGGGAMTAAEWTNNLINEHTYACSHGGTRTYPYGDTIDNTKCNGGTNTTVAIEPVKTRAACESGWGGVYDLAGNVHEWANGCVVGADPKTDTCALQDSATGHPNVEMPCTSWFAYPRQATEDEVGFRCCAD